MVGESGFTLDNLGATFGAGINMLAPSAPQMNFNSMAGLTPGNQFGGGFSPRIDPMAGYSQNTMLGGIGSGIDSGITQPQSQGWDARKLGLLDQEGNINWDNLGNFSKGAAGLTQAGFGIANYFDQKSNNKDARAQAREILEEQRKMNAINASGQQRYMAYKGWGTDEQKDKYNRLVDDLTNTSLA